jgi:hypothetical protein
MDCSLKDEESIEFSTYPTWKIILDLIIINVAISEIDALMYVYVVLSKAKNMCFMGHQLVPLNV